MFQKTTLGAIARGEQPGRGVLGSDGKKRTPSGSLHKAEVAALRDQAASNSNIQSASVSSSGRAGVSAQESVLLRDSSSISAGGLVSSDDAGMGMGRTGQFRAVLTAIVLRNETLSSNVDSGEIGPSL